MIMILTLSTNDANEKNSCTLDKRYKIININQETKAKVENIEAGFYCDTVYSAIIGVTRLPDLDAHLNRFHAICDI